MTEDAHVLAWKGLSQEQQMLRFRQTATTLNKLYEKQRRRRIEALKAAGFWR